MGKTTKSEADRLAALSIDCSFMLSHLIRQRQDSKIINSDDEAKKKLTSILALDSPKNQMVLKSNKIGWYKDLDAKIHDPECNYNPNHPGNFFPPKQKNGVCFTESTLMGLKAHREIFKTKYGIAFRRDYLFERGANPCLNIRDEILKLRVNNLHSNYCKLYNFIPENLIGYINVIHESFDATHEREWRHLGDFKFKRKNILFVFCPYEDFEIFSKIQRKGMPILFDLKWLDKI